MIVSEYPWMLKQTGIFNKVAIIPSCFVKLFTKSSDTFSKYSLKIETKLMIVSTIISKWLEHIANTDHNGLLLGNKSCHLNVFHINTEHFVCGILRSIWISLSKYNLRSSIIPEWCPIKLCLTWTPLYHLKLYAWELAGSSFIYFFFLCICVWLALSLILVP